MTSPLFDPAIPSWEAEPDRLRDQVEDLLRIGFNYWKSKGESGLRGYVQASHQAYSALEGAESALQLATEARTLHLKQLGAAYLALASEADDFPAMYERALVMLETALQVSPLRTDLLEQVAEALYQRETRSLEKWESEGVPCDTRQRLEVQYLHALVEEDHDRLLPFQDALRLTFRSDMHAKLGQVEHALAAAEAAVVALSSIRGTDCLQEVKDRLMLGLVLRMVQLRAGSWLDRRANQGSGDARLHGELTAAIAFMPDPPETAGDAWHLAYAHRALSCVETDSEREGARLVRAVELLAPFADDDPDCGNLQSSMKSRLEML